MTVDGQPVRVSEDGVFLSGVGRDDTGTVTVVSSGSNGDQQRTISILPREYKIQRIDGLPKKVLVFKV